jgi:hypothetical protein
MGGVSFSQNISEFSPAEHCAIAQTHEILKHHMVYMNHKLDHKLLVLFIQLDPNILITSRRLSVYKPHCKKEREIVFY